MRLIDADKLIYQSHAQHSQPYINKKDIDNAPTVEMAEDCVKRDDVKSGMIKYGFLAPDMTVTEFVEDLPSVTPSRPKGKWIDDNCSICGYGVKPWNNTPYCPNCGADMREVQDDGI